MPALAQCRFVEIPRTSPARIADFNGHPLAESRQRGLDLLRLGGVLGIEHAADHSFVNPQAACGIGVVDLARAHRQVERQFRRQPKRHGRQSLPTLRG
jgi:hypothetical protein